MSDLAIMPPPSVFTALGLGFVLGMRHALDADHVAAVSTLLVRRPDWKLSGLIGCAWGVGHTATLLLVGIAVLLFKVSIPARVTTLLEGAVGVMLVLLGASLLVTLVRDRWHLHAHRHGEDTHLHLHSHRDRHDHAHPHWVSWGVSWLDHGMKPFAVGMVHGLAGSAALMLLVLSTVGTVWAGIAYILAFGVGSIGGMMLMGLLVSLPVAWSASLGPRVHLAVQGTASVGSLALGLAVIFRNGHQTGLF